MERWWDEWFFVPSLFPSLPGVAIGTNVHMYAEVSDDSVDIQVPTIVWWADMLVESSKILKFTHSVQVTGATDGWLGMGFSEGSSVSMIGGSGGGSDAFICSELEVKRYWYLGWCFPHVFPCFFVVDGEISPWPTWFFNGTLKDHLLRGSIGWSAWAIPYNVDVCFFGLKIMTFQHDISIRFDLLHMFVYLFVIGIWF